LIVGCKKVGQVARNRQRTIDARRSCQVGLEVVRRRAQPLPRDFDPAFSDELGLGPGHVIAADFGIHAGRAEQRTPDDRQEAQHQDRRDESQSVVR
jgi:hypothetical protein